MTPRCLFIKIIIVNCPKLSHTCNLSFSLGLIPPDLPLAKVNCISKSGDKTDPATYRPFSVLPAFSKNSEKKTVEVRLSKHMSKNRILKSAPFHFQRWRQNYIAVHSMERCMYTIFNEKHFG